jgi:hypothetical protein
MTSAQLPQIQHRPELNTNGILLFTNMCLIQQKEILIY